MAGFFFAKITDTTLQLPLSPSSVNLVPAQAGKVTRGLAMCQRQIVVCPPMGWWPLKGRWASCLRSSWSMVTLPLLLPYYKCCQFLFNHSVYLINTLLCNVSFRNICKWQPLLGEMTLMNNNVIVVEDIWARGSAGDGRGRLRCPDSDPDAAGVHPWARGWVGGAYRAETHQAAPVRAAAAPRERGAPGQHVDTQQWVNDHSWARVSWVTARGRTTAERAWPVPTGYWG